MDGPTPRGTIRALAATLWTVLAFVLGYYTSIPAELVGLLSGLYMAVWGVGEALYDSQHAAPA